MFIAFTNNFDIIFLFNFLLILTNNFLLKIIRFNFEHGYKILACKNTTRFRVELNDTRNKQFYIWTQTKYKIFY